MLGWKVHRISLLDRYRDRTEYRKVRSCDTYGVRIHVTILLSMLNTCCENTESFTKPGSAVPQIWLKWTVFLLLFLTAFCSVIQIAYFLWHNNHKTAAFRVKREPKKVFEPRRFMLILFDFPFRFPGRYDTNYIYFMDRYKTENKKVLLREAASGVPPVA